LDTLQLLLGGFLTCLTPANLLFAFIGCLLGTMIGVLPGIGPAAGTALLIPVTTGMDATGSIIMLAAIYYGAMYGGTITSVLIRTPGEAASVVTCIDGYEMAKQGRAGVALSIAAIGSFIGGTIATLGLVFLALPLTKLALTFGPPEIFALLLVGMTFVTGLASRSLVRGLIAAVLGLLLAQIGIDPMMGAPRFTFGRPELLDGFGIIPVVMGLFGIAEILTSVEARAKGIAAAKVTSLMLTADDWRRSIGPILRGTGIGFVLGLVPGIGSMIPTFLSYAMEKRLSPNPERFGNGAIEGVAGPETANNACANSSLIPLFTLGIPSSPTTAILMSAFVINGLTPGPQLFVQHPQFVWAVIASLVVGNVMLLILNLPFIPLWVAILKIPHAIMVAIIVGFSIIGAYSISNNVFDVGAMLGFGVVGYIFRKLDIPSAPLVLTVVLAPLMEQALRQSLEMSQGTFSIFFERPITATLIAVAVALVVVSTFRAVKPVQGVDSET
jgi:putative tricarboxylic transport membrane protein